MLKRLSGYKDRNTTWGIVLILVAAAVTTITFLWTRADLENQRQSPFPARKTPTVPAGPSRPFSGLNAQEALAAFDDGIGQYEAMAKKERWFGEGNLNSGIIAALEQAVDMGASAEQINPRLARLEKYVSGAETHYRRPDGPAQQAIRAMRAKFPAQRSLPHRSHRTHRKRHRRAPPPGGALFVFRLDN